MTIASASDTAAISVARIFVRSAYSLSAFAQRSPSSTRNASSAVSCFFVIPSSCFECASSSFAADSAAVLSITCSLRALISFILPALRASKSDTAVSSSPRSAERLVVNVSFICSRMPKMSPDLEL